MLRKLKEILPERLVESLKGTWVHSVYGWIHLQNDPVKYFIIRHLFPILYWSGMLSSVHYIFSQAFSREHRGVLYGRWLYARELHENKKSSYRLRRNIHMIEKGLCMRSRRKIFAVDYIGDTVEAYERVWTACRDAQHESVELSWAHDVIAKYFSVVGSHPKIDNAERKFRSLSHESNKQGGRIPYRRNLNDPPPVDYDDLYQLALRRRSVRWYLDKPVPREMVDKAIMLCGLSPTACNRQPFEFRVFDEPDLVRQLVKMPAGTRGYAENIPAVIVAVGKLRAFFDERDRHLIYTDSSLAIMSLLLALETLGLSSCTINWADISYRERRIAKFLNLAADERVIMMIAIGYPDPEGMVAFSAKKSLDEIRRYNFDAR